MIKTFHQTFAPFLYFTYGIFGFNDNMQLFFRVFYDILTCQRLSKQTAHTILSKSPYFLRQLYLQKCRIAKPHAVNNTVFFNKKITVIIKCKLYVSKLLRTEHDAFQIQHIIFRNHVSSDRLHLC